MDLMFSILTRPVVKLIFLKDIWLIWEYFFVFCCCFFVFCFLWLLQILSFFSFFFPGFRAKASRQLLLPWRLMSFSPCHEKQAKQKAKQKQRTKTKKGEERSSPRNWRFERSKKGKASNYLKLNLFGNALTSIIYLSSSSPHDFKFPSLRSRE